jgi:predicted phosphoribosyltransferase
MILAIPSGGVPVAIKMSEILGLPFDLLIVRKLQIPGNPEAGFGAMTLAGTAFLNENLLAQLRLNPAQIDAEKNRVAQELEKRNRMFRSDRPFPDLRAKRIILILLVPGIATRDYCPTVYISNPYILPIGTKS